METNGLTLDLTAIDWSLVRSFAAVMRTGNLTRAAKALKTTQPTVGRHIRKLEALIGEVLFDRVADGFRPTARAAELFEKAEALDDAVTAFSRSLKGVPAGLVGTVRVTTTHAFGSEVLPVILAEVLHDNPELEIELSVNDASENLLRREADIAVRFFQPVQDDLIARRIGTLSLGLYAHKRYFERTGLAVPQTPADLPGHVIVGEEKAERAIDFGKANAVALSKRDVRFRSDAMLTQRAAIRAGIGIGPAIVVQARHDADLVRIFPATTVATLPVWIVAHDDLTRSARMRAVFDHLVRRLSAFVD